MSIIVCRCDRHNPRCKHFRGARAFGKVVEGESGGEVWTCDAFPGSEGIPYDICVGKNDHTKPFPGDHGIQYEPKTASMDGTRRVAFLPGDATDGEIQEFIDSLYGEEDTPRPSDGGKKRPKTGKRRTPAKPDK